MYKPKPINTSDIKLPDSINKLIEKLAENTHDLWAQQRINDGWTLGENRNDLLKKHPCLVPYEELPEQEKVYDRITAVETLKLIMAMGYSIHKEDQ